MRRYDTLLLAVACAVWALASCSPAGAQLDEPAPDPILIEGDPPLRQSDVDLLARLIAFAFDSELTARQAETIAGHVKGHWGERDELLPNLPEARAAWERASELTGPEREVARLSMRDGFMKAAEGQPDEDLARLQRRLYDAANPVIMTGRPPLRRRSVDALVSIVEWLATQAAGRTVELSEGQRGEVRRSLARQYPRSMPGDRMLLAYLEQTYYWMLLQWERAGPEEQANFRANLAGAFGVVKAPLAAPFTGETAKWEHPDGLFSLEYPSDWPARYGSLSEATTSSGWLLLDVTVLGEAPAEALELNALPTAGALVFTGVLPEEARTGRMTFHEAAFAFAAEILGASGKAEPLGEAAATDRAALMPWRHETPEGEFAALVSAVAVGEPEGGVILTVTRAPADQLQDLEPAFSRIIHSLRIGAEEEPELAEELGFVDPIELALDLLDDPLRVQMDLIEGLSSGMR